MSKERPRTEIFFHTIQTGVDLNYIPSATRDRREARKRQEKRSGNVVLGLQHLGASAAAAAYLRIVEQGNREDIRNAANIFGVINYGTAYHLMAEGQEGDVMYRRVRLPRHIDSQTGERLTYERLVLKAGEQMINAASLAATIEELHDAGLDTRRENIALGRVLAKSGTHLYNIHDDITAVRGDESSVQHASYISAIRGLHEMIEVSGAIGTRPSIAQVADEHSPLRRYMNDNPGVVNPDVYDTIMDSLEYVKSKAD